MIPNIHLLGIQGSGKGTQSSLLVKHFQTTYIGSGNLFRERAAKGDSEGLEISALMRGGSLLPDALLVSTISSFLASNPPNKMLLCDGVIRTLAQLTLLDEIWPNFELDAPLLIFMELDETTARERVEMRKAESKLPEKFTYHSIFSGKLVKREDDNPQALEERFRLFRTMTEPIIQTFTNRGRCITVSADQSIELVNQAIVRAIRRYYPELS